MNNSNFFVGMAIVVLFVWGIIDVVDIQNLNERIDALETQIEELK